MSQLFAYHPITGARLVKTVDSLIVECPTIIYRKGESITVDAFDIDTPCLSASSRISLDDAPFVQTGSGHVCLLSEAIWSPQNVATLSDFVPGKATDFPTYNDALKDLLKLGRAARNRLVACEGGDLARAVIELERAFQDSDLLAGHLGAVGK